MRTPTRPFEPTQDHQPLPDYTTTVLVMAFINLLWILGVIWALYGLPAVFAAGWVVNYGIAWLRR
ncbi:hypothetical protein ACRARG_16070 [Pseudooceanicola sp. C21-150M6]|uniref:hypothetical protein n=1 Tax=Pseudooceanicola sp. C21-150M6 TaxID=3434355 RepID=UPI003D7F4B63